MENLDLIIQELTSQKEELENKIETNDNPGERCAFKCALDKVHKSLGELNIQKFFLGSSNDKNKSKDGLSKFFQ